MNKLRSLDDKIVEELSPIRITSYAFDLSNYIARRVCELAEEKLEIGFYMLDDSLAGRKPDIVVRDVFVGHEQTVKSLHCDITPMGNMRSYREIRSMKKRIVGWGHSHASIGTFYSGEDDTTIAGLVKQWGIKKKVGLDTSNDKDYRLGCIHEGERKGLNVIIRGEKLSLELSEDSPPILKDLFNLFLDHVSHDSLRIRKYTKVEIPFFYGMTFNAANSGPHCVIQYIFNNVPRKLERGVTFAIVEPRESLSIDKKLIDQQLISRVLELREKYSHFNEVLDEDFETVKKSYVQAVKAINNLKILGIGKAKEAKELGRIYDNLETCMKLTCKYDSEDQVPFVSDPSKLEEYKPKIRSYFDQLMGKLAENLQPFNSRLIELATEYSKMDGVRRFGKDKLKAVLETYIFIITATQKYVDGKGGEKND